MVEPAEPTGELFSPGYQWAIERALAKKRPELESRLQLDMDDINIILAHNQMQPTLTLNGTYTAGGLGGNQFLFDNTKNPPVLVGVVPGGLGDALLQISAFQFPTYQASLTLSLPIRNRAAEAAVGTNEVNKKRDLFNQRATFQSIQLEAQRHPFSRAGKALHQRRKNCSRSDAKKSGSKEQA